MKFRLLPALPAITLLAMLGPVVAGLLGTVLPALGHFPAIGLTGPDFRSFATLLNWPGFGASVLLSVATGFVTTLIALITVVLLTAGWSGTPLFSWLEKVLSPLLSVPHAAAAFGLAFLIAPSGWISRMVSPGFTGWDRPPDALILSDPMGFSLMAGLIVKEVPFLLLMTLAALGQADVRRSMHVAAALGYRRTTGWLKVVFPRVYGQIKLPVYVVLAYSMSVVDVAIILGPTTPPTLSVQIVKWMSDPDLSMRTVAAAAAICQLILVIAALIVWRIGETLVARLGARWVHAGGRGSVDPVAAAGSAAFGVLSALAVLLGLLVLAIWSFAGFWGFPDAMPDQFTVKNWMRHGDGVVEALGVTFLIAGVSTLVALILTIGCLEAEHRYDLRLTRRGMWLLYLPLLVPQTAFLPGLQTLFIGIRAEIGMVPVVLAHIVFVLPYVFLSLADPFRAWDNRMSVIGAALMASPDRVLWQLRLPMLLRPLLTALAIGIAVSVGQYLPTLLMGGGRVETLTTEAVALASGGDRRAIGVYGLAQTGAAFLPFMFALFIPVLIWRNRLGMRHE